ncbi:hypothetical protein AO369_0885 [Moraxella catarrhalis]|nr:hypothetical protein AO381_1474 [Moraxella catarrhalis]OAV27689.1 hypothetical protein AO369_0885 [Moraxella catarrhalis]
MYADHYVIWLNNSIQTINLGHQKKTANVISGLFLIFV